jgi:hypothetical protein
MITLMIARVHDPWHCGLGGHLLVFAGWFDIHAIIIWLLSEKYKIVL